MSACTYQVARQVPPPPILDSSPNERNILRAGFVSLGTLWSYYLPVLPSPPASSDLKRAKWALIVAVLNDKLKIQHKRLKRLKPNKW